MPLLPEETRNRASSIPVRQSTSSASVTSQAQSDMLYRGSSLCSSASSSLASLTSTSGPASTCHSPTRDQQACLSHSVHRRDKEEEEQQEQVSSSTESNITISSVSSSNSSSSDSSTNEESSQTEPHHINDDDDDNINKNKNKNKNIKMLSVDNISSSNSTSSIDSFHLSTGDEAPMLPPRSARRVSRLTMPIPPEKTPSNERPMLPHAAPHQLYLSSEEDASSSADDFSDFAEELESDSEKSEKTTERRVSREDTARLVSVIFYGKPSIVTMSRRSLSPSSSNGQQTGASLLRTSTEPTLSRPRSNSPTGSSTMAFDRPPRSSSMITTGGVAKKRPGFLQIDPYSKGDEEFPQSARTPKTPTAMFRKTLNLVKKRSKQNLQQCESHISPMEQVGEVEEEHDPREIICLEPPTPVLVSYQDIIRSAKRNTLHPISRSEVSSPKSPRNRFRSGLSLGRQRGVQT
ncbi:hypothetical protein E4U55_002883 [Claviceps digitariae]|nr:hypothetical protein E4U55_002883 [Claviceps digitariae]